MEYSDEYLEWCERDWQAQVEWFNFVDQGWAEQFERVAL